MNTARSIAMLGAALLLASCSPEHPKFNTTDVTGADWGRTLALTGHDGKPRTLADFRGKVVVLAFGFTHCPDVCPTTLASLARVLKNLKRNPNRVQVLFMTLDPERDSAAVLAKYVPAFDPAFIGLYGDAEATRRTAKEFKIFYAKRAEATPGSYAVDHSAQSYVFDAKGRLRLMVKHEQLDDDLVHDLRELLREG